MKSNSLLLSRLHELTDDLISYETSRIANRQRLEILFVNCVLDEGFSCVEELFEFKAMNLMGISLNEMELGHIQVGRYIQLLVIAAKKKGEKKSTSISLGYFGKAELVDSSLVADLAEFVLRWRYEKSFLNVNHYKNLISALGEHHES